MNKLGFEPLNLTTNAVLPNVLFIMNDLIRAEKCVPVSMEHSEGYMTQFSAVVTCVLVYSVSYKVYVIFLLEHKANLNKLINGRLLYTSQNFLSLSKNPPIHYHFCIFQLLCRQTTVARLLLP